MSLRRIALLVAGIVALPQSSLLAQIGSGTAAPHMVQVGFGGGVSVPTSHAADALKNGFNGQAYVILNLGIPLRFNLGYQKFDFKDVITGGGATTGSSSMLSGVGGLMFNLPQMGPLGAYVTAGVGAFNLTEDVGGTSTSNVKFGIDGGAGVTLKLGRLQAFVEGRVQNVYTDKGVIDTRTITAIPVTFGVLF